jgi:hypothetical protein
LVSREIRALAAIPKHEVLAQALVSAAVFPALASRKCADSDGKVSRPTRVRTFPDVATERSAPKTESPRRTIRRGPQWHRSFRELPRTVDKIHDSGGTAGTELDFEGKTHRKPKTERNLSATITAKHLRFFARLRLGIREQPVPPHNLKHTSISGEKTDLSANETN